MKLKVRSFWGRDRGNMDICDVVGHECTDYDHPDSISRVQGNIIAMADVLGRLVQELHESRALSDEAVLRIVGSGYEKA